MTARTKVILKDVDPDEFGLAIRAARWLLREPDSQRDAILAYGDGNAQRHFYVCRNKSSITVRPC